MEWLKTFEMFWFVLFWKLNLREVVEEYILTIQCIEPDHN